MQTLALEGERYDIRVNGLAPSAATAMTNHLYPAEALAGPGPELVSPAIPVLVATQAPTLRILLAGAGSFEQANITMTQGLYLGSGPSVADALASRLEEVAAQDGETLPESGGFQYPYQVDRALAVAQPVRKAI